MDVTGAEPQDAIVLAETRTPFERRAVQEWAARTHPGVPVCDLADADVAGLTPRTALIPARVVWLPAVRGGERRVTMTDLLVAHQPAPTPRRGPGPDRRPVPDRVRVVAGESATIEELRERYDHAAADDVPFADWVGVQATLSAERAERQVIGDRYRSRAWWPSRSPPAHGSARAPRPSRSRSAALSPRSSRRPRTSCRPSSRPRAG